MLTIRATALAVTACLAAPAGAATFVPNRFDDPPPGFCTAADCSLREAVMAADGTAALDTIELAPGEYVLTRTTGTEPASFDLDVTTQLAVVSTAGIARVSVATGTPGPENRAFDVDGTSLVLNGVSIAGGDVGKSDGGCGALARRTSR